MSIVYMFIKTNLKMQYRPTCVLRQFAIQRSDTRALPFKLSTIYIYMFMEYKQINVKYSTRHWSTPVVVYSAASTYGEHGSLRWRWPMTDCCCIMLLLWHLTTPRTELSSEYTLHTGRCSDVLVECTLRLRYYRDSKCDSVAMTHEPPFWDSIRMQDWEAVNS